MNIHDMAREVLEMEELPDLDLAGICNLFTDMQIKAGGPDNFDAYYQVAHFNREDGWDYLGTSTGWNEARLIFLLLLAETNEEDFVSKHTALIAQLIDKGLTKEEATQAMSNRLDRSIGVPLGITRLKTVGRASDWVIYAFGWRNSPQGFGYWDTIYDRLLAKEAREAIANERTL